MKSSTKEEEEEAAAAAMTGRAIEEEKEEAAAAAWVAVGGRQKENEARVRVSPFNSCAPMGLKLCVFRGGQKENEARAEFGAKVAGESVRNERIAAKPRRPLLDQMRTQQYASVKPCVRILYVGGTPKRLFRHRCVRIQSFYAYALV
ncbi:hypothetical protein PIB30_062650, partial [Stylosanthes scabra]|nr:hypothetical protein [Stylosanthes scabra]